MNGKEKDLLTPKEAAELLNIQQQTLIRWSKEGNIKSIRTKGGHRRYLRSDIFETEETNSIKENQTSRRKICYCRVSTREQKKDLERQEKFFRLKYPNHEIISDYGSGLNFKKKGLETILDGAIKGDIEEIVVTYKDRLCRFGFELIERIISRQGGKIVVLNREKTSPQEELVNDLISIITVFSSRVHGLRSHELKNQIKNQIENHQIQTISNTGREEQNSSNDGSI